MIIADKFRGPPQSGNGGYVAGICAGLLEQPIDQAVEVTLRAPIPLDQTLQPHLNESGAIVCHGETLIAEVKAAELEVSHPPVLAWDKVEAARETAYALQDNLQDFMPGIPGYHPVCFCCGAGNPDGLQVFVAPVDEQMAAIWPTDPNWADAHGLVPIEYLWTAMDCPGQFAFIREGVRTGLLGRMTARILKQPKAGESLLVNAWTIKIEGKKHYAGAAIYNRDGELCG